MLIWKCEKCRDSGGDELTRSYCSCEAGKRRRENVEKGTAICPACLNSGVSARTVTNGLPQLVFCECPTGFRLKKQAKDSPQTCPICHGQAVLPIFKGKEKIGEMVCPHTL